MLGLRKVLSQPQRDYKRYLAYLNLFLQQDIYLRPSKERGYGSKIAKVVRTMSTGNHYVMNTKWGAIAMFISATGMGLVPLFSRWATRTDMFDGTKGLNAGNSVGALMATGRMAMGVIFFVCLVLMTKKVKVWKELKVSPAIIMGGVMIGLSLGCYDVADHCRQRGAAHLHRPGRLHCAGTDFP